LPATTADEETTRWGELFRYPRSMAAGCLIALSQTGGTGILMWITALFVMVLKVMPNEAAYMMIWVCILGIISRLVASWIGHRGPALFREAEVLQPLAAPPGTFWGYASVSGGARESTPG